MRLWLIKFLLWLLKKIIQSLPNEERKSALPNLVGDSSDPCHLYLDAKNATKALIQSLLTQLEDLMLLYAQQTDIYDACRLQHPVEPTEPG